MELDDQSVAFPKDLCNCCEETFKAHEVSDVWRTVLNLIL